jgi:hypothetical protein
VGRAEGKAFQKKNKWKERGWHVCREAHSERDLRDIK